MPASNNISYFKAFRNSLLQQLYANEKHISIGRVRFANPPYQGLDLKLWKDAIYIEYNKLNRKQLSQQARARLEDLQSKLKGVFICKYCQFGVVVQPINKDEFPDSKMGMKLRADYYVLIADLCLKCFKE
jgi:hypothetical protein